MEKSTKLRGKNMLQKHFQGSHFIMSPSIFAIIIDTILMVMNI